MRESTNNVTNMLCTIAMGALLVSAVKADVRLPRLVDDHMVLQRDSKISLWGWADPGEKVQVEFQGKQFKVSANHEGRWSISLGPYPAGGPYDLAVTGKNQLILRDILVGDVWLASGQSNMEFPLQNSGEWRTGINNSAREIASAHFSQIRLFNVQDDTASSPKFDVSSDGWRAVTPQSVAEFSAVAYLFGRDLHQRYGVPIGLIQSDWAGTVAEAWMSETALRQFPEFHESLEFLKKTTESQSDYDRYVRQRANWYQQHGTEDRGRAGDRDIWADPAFDDSAWPTVLLPRPEDACGKDLHGFGGIVWFRRVVTVPTQHAGKELLLHLGQLTENDETYFNGVKVGETQGAEKSRDYPVPGKYVYSGQNILAIRLIGFEDYDEGCTGMYTAEQPSVEFDNGALPLTGTWVYQPGADLRDFPVANAVVATIRSLPNVPTALFNGMINPLLPFRIKGVIWYQGESNALDNRAIQYRALFPALIQDWRQRWGYELPFLFVQLAGFGYNNPAPAEYPWAELREAQSMALALPNTGMATAVDIGDEIDIHPRNKQDVAHRLALVAAKVAYGQNIVFSGPTYESMQIEGDQIRIKYSNLGSGLQVRGNNGKARGFEIAGADGKFHWAHARQNGQEIVVSNEKIKQPIAVRYSWSNTPDGNVYNQEDLPAVPFRTDTKPF
jgi:sialate O-acetylesterase